MFIVVGSGHAGIACAVSLVESGIPVTLIDGGITIDPDTERVVQSMSTRTAAQWSDAERRTLKGNVSASAKGVQIKKIFGSDFPFQDVDRFIPRDNSHIGHLTPSLAVAGFSNVWGAAALPFSERDLEGWPCTLDELAPFYRSINRFMPLTGEKDGLESLFPLFSPPSGTLRPSAQATRVLKSLKRRESSLKKRHLIFGTPRLAVRASSSHQAPPEGLASCCYCGSCLFGCPYGHIYSTNQTLQFLKQFQNFRHVPNVIVKKIVERGGTVTVQGVSRLDGTPQQFTGDKLFLAAGILSTSSLLLSSLELYDTPIPLLTSEYFMLPVLSFTKISGVDSEDLHTMSQLFIECLDPSISKHSAHMQLYTYSEHFKLGLYETFGKLGPLLRVLESQILGRLMVIQGYLHSDVSSRIELQLTKTPSGDRLQVKGVTNPLAHKTIKRLVSKLSAALLPSGLIPIRPMLNIGAPGEGRHVGGSFPMRTEPRRGESDVWGVPHGFTHVHVVDSTVFPTVPASTITFSAMANAQRIACHVAKQSSLTKEKTA